MFGFSLGLPISEVEFPSVVICSQGFSLEAIVANMQTFILNEIGNNTTEDLFNLTAFQRANLSIRSWKKVWHLATKIDL